MPDIIPDTREVFAVNTSVNEGPKPEVSTQRVQIIPPEKNIPAEPALRQLTGQEQVSKIIRQQNNSLNKKNSATWVGDQAIAIRTNSIYAPPLETLQKPVPAIPDGMKEAPIVPPSSSLVKAPAINPVLPKTGVNTSIAVAPIEKRTFFDRLLRRE